MRCSAARSSISGLSYGGPAKFKAPKSFLNTEGSLKVENKEHLFDFVVTLYPPASEVSRKVANLTEIKILIPLYCIWWQRIRLSVCLLQTLTPIILGLA